MTSARPLVSEAMRAAAARDDVGTVIRLARRGAGWTQADLGSRCGYSASTISRIEQGRSPAHLVDVRRDLAATLGLPADLLGLSANHRPATHQPTDPPPPGNGAMVAPAQPTTEGVNVRRRDLLAAAGAAALPLPTSRPTPTATREIDALLTTNATQPAAWPVLARALATARHDFNLCRYTELLGRLPDLLGQAAASRDAATGPTRQRTAGLLSAGYRLASALCIKLDNNAAGWVLADRAATAARESNNPVALAEAARRAAIAMRRAGHHTAAVDTLTTAATTLATHHKPLAVATYGGLLCTAAYTSAQHGDQATAQTLITEAAQAAARLDGHNAHTDTPFNPATISSYQIGVHTALGDTATALACARAVDLRRLPTSERRSRYLIDLARAWHKHGAHDRATQALLAAEQHAPQDVRRPSVRTLISTLLYSPGRHPTGLRELARRVGLT